MNCNTHFRLFFFLLKHHLLDSLERLFLGQKMLISLTAPGSDETRVSYLLEGVESAWDSIGRRNPQAQRKVPSVSAYRHQPDGAAAASASASRSADVQGQKERGFDGGDDLRGAEAMVAMAQAGNNVSLSITPWMSSFGFETLRGENWSLISTGLNSMLPIHLVRVQRVHSARRSWILCCRALKTCCQIWAKASCWPACRSTTTILSWSSTISWRTAWRQTWTNWTEPCQGSLAPHPGSKSQNVAFQEAGQLFCLQNYCM